MIIKIVFWENHVGVSDSLSSKKMALVGCLPTKRFSTFSVWSIFAVYFDVVGSV